MINIYVTSDLFLGKNSKALERGYKNAQEMNSDIVKKWNSTITESDEIYVLGNFFWDPITASEIINLLNGKIYLIKGEYDKSAHDIISNNLEIYNKDIFYLDAFDTKYVLSHYPLEHWKNKLNSSIHLHGCFDKVKLDLNKMNRFNIMADLWGLTPINIKEFKELIKDYKQAKNKIK